jgi:hypothetical protein
MLTTIFVVEAAYVACVPERERKSGRGKGWEWEW